MRTTIDKAGRVVIPRQLRERVGLLGGGTVEVDLDGAAIRIAPIAGEQLRRRDGLLLIPATGARVDRDMIRELIDADRHGS